MLARSCVAKRRRRLPAPGASDDTRRTKHAKHYPYQNNKTGFHQRERGVLSCQGKCGLYVGPYKTVMPYILSRPCKLSQHWPLTSAACNSTLLCSFFIEVFEIGLQQLMSFQWGCSHYSFVGFARYGWKCLSLTEMSRPFSQKTIQNWEIYRYLKSNESNLKALDVSIRQWAGQAALLAGWSSKHRDSVEHRELLYRPTTATFCLAPHGTQVYKSCVWPNIFGVSTACALARVFTIKSWFFRRYLEVYLIWFIFYLKKGVSLIQG